MEMGSPGKHGQTSRSWNLFFCSCDFGELAGTIFWPASPIVGIEDSVVLEPTWPMITTYHNNEMITTMRIQLCFGGLDCTYIDRLAST